MASPKDPQDGPQQTGATPVPGGPGEHRPPQTGQTPQAGQAVGPAPASKDEVPAESTLSGSESILAETAADWEEAIEEWDLNLELSEAGESRQRKPSTAPDDSPLPGSFAFPEEADPLPPLPGAPRALPDFQVVPSVPPTLIADLDPARRARLQEDGLGVGEVVEAELPAAPPAEAVPSARSRRTPQARPEAKTDTKTEAKPETKTHREGVPEGLSDGRPTGQPREVRDISLPDFFGSNVEVSAVPLPPPPQSEALDGAPVEPSLPQPLPVDDDFYDVISIESLGQRDSLSPSAGRVDPESTDGKGTPAGVADPLFTADFADERPSGEDDDFAGLFDDDGDRTPRPGEDRRQAPPAASAVSEPQTIHIEAELPPGMGDGPAAGSAATPLIPAAAAGAMAPTPSLSLSMREGELEAGLAADRQPAPVVEPARAVVASSPVAPVVSGPVRAPEAHAGAAPTRVAEPLATAEAGPETVPEPLPGATAEARVGAELAAAPSARSARTTPPSARSPLPSSVMSPLVRSRMTPERAAAPAGAELLPRRVALPSVAELPDPPTLRGAVRGGISGETRRQLLDILDGENRVAPRVGASVFAARQAEALQEPAEALDRYRASLELSPNCRPALRGLRRMLSMPGPAAQPDEAVAVLDRELGRSSEAEQAGLLLQRAELLLSLGQIQGAASSYREALAKKTVTGDERRNRLPLCGLTGLLDSALREGGEGVQQRVAALTLLGESPGLNQHGPLRAALQIERARVHEALGQDPAALSAYQASQSVPEVALAAGLGALQTAQRMPSAAPLDLEPLLAVLSPSSFKLALLTLVGRTGLLTGPAESGGPRLAALAEAAVGGDRLAKEELALWQERTADFTAAAIGFEGLAGLIAEPGHRSQVLTRAGELYDRAGQSEAALRVLRLAVDIARESQAGDAIASRALERVQSQAGLTEGGAGATAESSSASSRRGQDSARLAVAHWRAAQRLAGAGATDSAIGELAAALALRKDLGPALSLSRELLVQAGRFGEAAHLLLEAMGTGPAAAPPTKELSQGETALHLSYVEDAVRLLARAGRAAEGAQLLAEWLQAVRQLNTRRALRWQLARVLAGRIELAPETEPRLAAILAASFLAEAEEIAAPGWSPKGEPSQKFDREARGAAVIDREARGAAVIDREARGAAVIDREARGAAVIDREGVVDAARAADLWFRMGLLLHPLNPLAGPTAASGPVERGFHKALSVFPAHGPALVALTGRLLGAEVPRAQIEDTLSHYRQRLVAAAGRPEAALLLLRIAALQQHKARTAREAATSLRSMIERAPAHPGADAVADTLLDLAVQSDDQAGLLELLERALQGEREPEQRFALLLQVGEVYEAQRQPARAAALYSEALELRRGHPLARAALSRTYLASGQTAALRTLAESELAEATDVAGRVGALERLAALASADGAPSKRSPTEQSSSASSSGSQRGAASPLSFIDAYRAILAVDANHHMAMRLLERHYIAAADIAELVHLYEQMGLTASDAGFAVHIHLDRARLRQRLAWHSEQEGGEKNTLLNELENDFRLALFRDSHSRPALRHVLASALRTHDLNQVADLSIRLADICDQSGTGRGEAGDGRAAAVFLTRAAECYAALQQPAQVVTAAFRTSLDRNPRHLPAIRGLLQHALAQGNWGDVVEMCQLLGAALHDPDERYRSYHLAGAVAEDHLRDMPRANQLYREALRVDPQREGAFNRLKGLLSGGTTADPNLLSELLQDQLRTTADPRRQIELRLELANLLCGAMDNRVRAKVELRQALSYDPAHPQVLERLAELHFEDAEWVEAADLLIRRARVERRPAALAEIFLLLGQIYGEHLPDPRRAVASYTRALELAPEHVAALSQLSALHLQQQHPEAAIPLLRRLAEQTSDREQKVTYLHRIARLHEGLGEVRAAETAFRQAADVDPIYLPAVGELAQFFDRQSDVQSMRVHLDRSAAHWRQMLRKRPDDLLAYQALLQIYLWRRSNDQAAMTAEVILALGGQPAVPPEAAPLVERVRGHYPREALRDPALDEMLFPPSIPAGFRHIFSLLHEQLAKSYRTDSKKLTQMGVDKRERLQRSGHPLRDLANRIAQDLGLGEFEIYVTAAQGQDEAGQPAPYCTLENTEVPALILSQSLLPGATEDELRFYLGRLLKLLQTRMILPLRLSADDLGLLAGGLVRQFVPDYAPIGIAEKRIAAEAQKLQRLIPRKLQQQLLPFALECASSSLDLTDTEATLTTVGNHAGLLICGRFPSAHTALLRLGPAAAPQIRELLLFAVSQEFTEMRRLVGVALG